MAKHPWRFQGDIAYGEADPTVTVFMGEVEEELDAEGDPTGNMVIKQDTRAPVTMKLSELASASHLADPDQMGKVADAQKQARRKAKQDADAQVAEVAEAVAAVKATK